MEKVQGLAETASLMERVPLAAEAEMRNLLEVLAEETLAGQRRDAPERTGYLRGKLSIQEQLDRLRVKIGLFRDSRRTGQSSAFYGRIIELGRSAQVVLVQRRRRVKGALRTSRRRKIAADIAATYSLRVRARAPYPFVRKDRPELRVEQRIAEFWAKTLSRAEA